MAAMFTGQIAAQAPESSLRITDVRVRYPDALRFGPGRFDPSLALRRLAAPARGQGAGARRSAGAGPRRAAVRRGRVAPTRTPDEQWRENQQPAAFVTAELNQEQAGLGSVAANVRPLAGQTCICRPATAGSWAATSSSSRRPSRACRVMLTAVLLVYVMLAFQFRSVVLPLLIFLTQPLSIVSGLFALWITGTPLNVSSYMGAILLVGLDMKNGILLVEYIQKLREEGMELRPALLLAGRTPLPADPDDEPGGHPRPVPAGAGHRPRRPDAAAVGDHGHRRPDREHAVHAGRHPGRL